MPQVDLIIDTCVRAPAAELARQAHETGLSLSLWPRWVTRLTEDRGAEGTRWVLDDARAQGTTEVWIRELRRDVSVARVFVRVDRVGRPWPRWYAMWLRPRVRADITSTMWGLKDVLER